MKGTVKKRGNTWSYIVDIGRDLITGKRRQKTKGGFPRQKDADAALRKILNELDANRYLEPSKESFSSYMEFWFTSHYQKRIKETTASSRKYLMDKHLIRENPFANKPLSKITTEDIDAFYNLKLDEEYSTSTIRKLHQLLNQAFGQAVKWKKISFNPVINADPPSVKKEEMKIWSFDEIDSFLNHCKGERHYLTFLLAIYTGMRKGELLGLKWSDIDFGKKSIRIQRSLSHIPNKGYRLSTPKTKKSKRQVPIPDFLVKELKAHKERQETQRKRLGEQYQDQDLVICTEIGTLQDPRNVLRVMKRISKAANVTSIRFHDIRHTHASILISEGVDIVKVAARLGHSDPTITLKNYAHLIPNQDDEVADIFHNALQKSR
ncbi:site-specific integrase [Peribacillus frigoritolerans]|uniref:site-specific integrase n=1 Tax=Peribacillus frigoritolerans TaxID=450367 RepID=UPI0024C18773|nr:site-specific integrase [Peribacillus frigoritolerans]WHX68241.1 site-specific integrase [Peribacillus frigoritolerans]